MDVLEILAPARMQGALALHPLGISSGITNAPAIGEVRVEIRRPAQSIITAALGPVLSGRDDGLIGIFVTAARMGEARPRASGGETEEGDAGEA